MNREIAAQEENQSALLKRDIPDMEFIIGLANTFRSRIAEAQTRSMGDAIDEFTQAFDDALDELQGKLLRAQGDI